VPWVLITQGNGSVVNNDLLGFGTGGVSDDGNKVVFSSWSSHGFGLATRNCSFDWIYVRDVNRAALSVAVREFNGKVYCGYESSPSLSGDGRYVIFRGQALPYSHSTLERSGIWRAPVGGSYVPVSAKGVELSWEYDGSLKVGELLRGSRGNALADTDGNSVVFTMSSIENSTDVTKQYASTLFTHPMLRTDQGAKPAGNQDYALTHSDTGSNYNSFDVSGNGGIVVYSEVIAGVRRYKAWDMLARIDAGDPFAAEREQQPKVSPLVCGMSSDGRYLLVGHNYAVPLDPQRPASLGFKKLSYQLSRYDRQSKTFEYVGVSEEESRSRDANCDAFLNGGLSRQMSKDGNRVAWRSSGFIFVRDIATQQTLKLRLPSTIHSWTISGNGEYIVFTSGVAPDGTTYKNQYGSNMTQIYRYGPITRNDFGAQFTLPAFEAKLLGN